MCEYDLATPFTAWLPLAWMGVYILCTETFMLGLNILILRGRSVIARRAPVSLLIVTGCALSAAAVARWLTYLNQRFCLAVPIVPHLSPELKAQLDRIYVPLHTQAVVDLRIGLSILAVLATLGTILAALTMVYIIRAWQAGGRRV